MSALLTPGSIWIHGPTMEEHEVLLIANIDDEIEVSTITPPAIYRLDDLIEQPTLAVKSWLGSRVAFLAEFMPPAAAMA